MLFDTLLEASEREKLKTEEDKAAEEEENQGRNSTEILFLPGSGPEHGPSHVWSYEA